MNDSPYTRLDLVRHGQVNTPGLLCASPDEPLSALGKAQMTSLQAELGWEIIVSSPSLRCREPAENLASQLNLPLVIDPAWREIGFGRWTGRTRKSIWDSDRDQLLKLWSKPLDFSAPQGESMVVFVQRVQSACKQLLEKHQGQSILLLTHAGVIRAILAQMLNIDYHATQKFRVNHAKINRLHAYPDGEFSLVNWGTSARDLLSS